MNSLSSWLTVAGVVLWSASATAIPAFPGAEGYGAKAVGGRGGRVLAVTNLNDNGPGSLRAAIEASGPRTVVFRVAGTIELMTELVLENPFITLAGQTAPGGGITLKTHPSNPRSAFTIRETAHDVIVRHLRFRPGPHEGFKRGRSAAERDTSEVKDALQILGARNVIIDHCSASWATDEVVSTFFGAQDVTIQWCIISEALRQGAPGQTLPGKGLLIGSKSAARISVHHNLMIHNIGRNPLIKASGMVEVVNNVVLAPASVAMAIDSELGPGRANFIGNYVLAPKGDGLVYGVTVIGAGPFELFVKGNLGPYRQREDQPDELFVDPKREARKWLVNAPHDAPLMATTSAAQALEAVLKSAGCLWPARDAVDQRLVQDVRSRTVRIVDDPAEVGGWPDLPPGSPSIDSDHDGMPDEWEQRHGFDPRNPADGALDRDGDGYTNLEAFLNRTAP